jgi:hypothetical protein
MPSRWQLRRRQRFACLCVAGPCCCENGNGPESESDIRQDPDETLGQVVDTCLFGVGSLSGSPLVNMADMYGKSKSA